MAVDTAADWLAETKVEPTKGPRLRAVKGLTCSKGHPWDEANTAWVTRPGRKPSRRCRACARAWARKSREKGRARQSQRDPERRQRPVKGVTCTRGHRWTKTNTRWATNRSGKRKRFCRACYREVYARRRRAESRQWWSDHRGASQARELAPDDPRHGELTGYNYWGCRCDACRRRYTEYAAERRARQARLSESAELVKRRAISAQAFSLDEKAEHRFGLDRVMTGSVFDDPVFDEVAAGSLR